ncbi:MAG: restriction endonuclease subunit S [SAR324 cluster bacterium]|nr:restriction endonuclease subunit S [SAR324 cluster bacterium]
MKNYKSTKLSNVAEVFSGFAFKSSDFREVGIPAIKISNVKNGYVDLEDNSTQYLDNYVLKKIDSKFVVKNGDVLTSLTGSHITQPNSVVGRVAQYKHKQNSLLNQRVGKIRVTNGRLCDLNFLFYYLSTKFVRQEIAQLAHGAANQANVSPKDIVKIKVPLPPLPIQKKIAAILSAYDELIENNNRRIAILEKMAEEIYREWFVRLRFPGYQNTEFEKGIPKGWDLKELGSLCKKVTDGSHSSPEYFEGGMYMASVKDMTAYGFEKDTMKTISEPDYEKLVKSDCKPFDNDILIAKDGSYLKHVFVWKDNYEVVILSSIAILRPNLDKILPYFFASLLKQPSTKSMMSGFVSGSALPRIILNDFKKMNLLVPAYELIKSFENKVTPMFNQIRTLLNINENLTNTKNQLLPRLISGKLDVESLDIAFPPGMKEEQETQNA